MTGITPPAGGAVRVIGLDLSLTATGIATPEGPATLNAGNLKGCARLASLQDQIYGRCRRADLVVIEGYSMGSHQAHSHALGELGGVIRLALWEAEIRYVDVPPASLKKYATGKGNAAKEQVLAAAIRRLGYEGHDHNQADALWLQAMGFDAIDHPIVDVPAAHRAALDAIDWTFGRAA